MTHITMFSTGTVRYLLDLELAKEPVDDNSSLFITHVENEQETQVRHFLKLDDLRTLRDLLNKKLPCDPVKLEPYVTIAPQTL